jgi:phage tail sheath gpL-like
MTVPFNRIPANLRVPFWYAEMDASQAGTYSQVKRTLLLGQMLAAGTATANVPVLVGTVSQAYALFGRGSMLARMYARYRAVDAAAELWCLPLADNAAGTAATGTITVTGPATASGTVSLYIGGQLVEAAVTSGDTATVIASAIVTAIGTVPDLAVTAASAAGVVTLTARHKGLVGNDLVVSDTYYGGLGGQALPAGVALAYVAMSGGASNPSLTAAVSGMGDEPFEYVVCPYTDATSLNALRDEFGDASGRWSYSRQLYGHVYSAYRGSLSTLTTFGAGRNDPHCTIAGIEADVQTPVDEYAAIYAAANAAFLNANVSRPTQYGELVGVLPARIGKRFLWSERQSLLNYGMATSVYQAGAALVERAVTTYQKNAQGYADNSYLDSETLFQSSEFLRRMRRVMLKYSRHGAASNGTNLGPGAAVVTPVVMEGELDAEYLRMEQDGLVENFKLWKKARRVERDANNPNRFNVLLTPDYVNQLRIVAVVNQFRLQFPG